MSPNNISITYKLYAEPSALEGVARIFDFAGTLNSYNTSRTPNEADIKAVAHDWVMVGVDLQGAVNTYGKEQR